MENSVIKKPIKKGKVKVCSAEKCNQITRDSCEKCLKASCEFHMCARIRDRKKIKICDACSYSEVKEQIDAENQKEKKNCYEKLQSINTQNKECIEEARIDEAKIHELNEKIYNIEEESKLKYNIKHEEISKEKYLKDKNLHVLANLKAAIENSNEISKTENEKLVYGRSQVSTLQIDVNQLQLAIKEKETLIKSLKVDLDECITTEKLMGCLCNRCILRAKGKSTILSASVVSSREMKRNKNDNCKCVIF